MTPREVWVVVDRADNPVCVERTEGRARRETAGEHVHKYILATTLDAELDLTGSGPGATAGAEAARVVAQACVDWAADTGDCHLCGEYERTASHGGDCPVNLYLASLETKSASPTPAAKPLDREVRLVSVGDEAYSLGLDRWFAITGFRVDDGRIYALHEHGAVRVGGMGLTRPRPAPSEPARETVAKPLDREGREVSVGDEVKGGHTGQWYPITGVVSRHGVPWVANRFGSEFRADCHHTRPATAEPEQSASATDEEWEYDGSCTECGETMEWEGDEPTTPEEARCHDCAVDCLTSDLAAAQAQCRLLETDLALGRARADAARAHASRWKRLAKSLRGERDAARHALYIYAKSFVGSRVALERADALAVWFSNESDPWPEGIAAYRAARGKP